MSNTMGFFSDLVDDFLSGGSGSTDDDGSDQTATEQEDDGGADSNAGPG